MVEAAAVAVAAVVGEVGHHPVVVVEVAMAVDEQQEGMGSNHRINRETRTMGAAVAILVETIIRTIQVGGVKEEIQMQQGVSELVLRIDLL